MRPTPRGLLFCLCLSVAALLCATSAGRSTQRDTPPARSAAAAPPRPAGAPRPATPRKRARAERPSDAAADPQSDRLELLRTLKGEDSDAVRRSSSGGAAVGVAAAAEAPQRPRGDLSEYLSGHEESVYRASFACPALGLRGEGEFKVSGSFFTLTQGSEKRSGMIFTRQVGDSFSMMLRLMKTGAIGSAWPQGAKSNYSFRVRRNGADSYVIEPAEGGLDCGVNIQAIGSNPPWPCKKPKCK